MQESKRVGGTSASSATTETVRTRATTTTMWVDGKDGKLPWAARKVTALGLGAGALLIAGSTAWAVPHIQGELEDETRADLEAAGIDASDLDVDFDYRDGEIRGTLPAGLDAAAVEELADHRGIRTLAVRATAAVASEASETPTEDQVAPTEDASSAATDTPTEEPTPTAELTTTEEPATATGPTEVTAALAGSTLTLRGTVLTEDQRTQLFEAATQLVGAGNVIDELTVSGLAEATPGAAGRIDDLSSALANLAGFTDATATLTDTSLDVTGTAPDQATADAASAAIGGLSAVAATADFSVAAAATPTVQQQVTDLQGELDSLAAELKETVVFATGSAELSDAARASLDKVVEAMARYPLPVVEISGHTDDRGDAGANQALSEERAAAVEAYLISQGVDAERLASRGAGESEPVASNDTAEGRGENRRVQLIAQAPA
jgi:OOP family OmpA-OmpF porin